MTLRGELQSMPMNEVRQKLRVAVEIAEAGSPLIVLEHGHPAAAMLRFDEVERWIRVERALSALHGLEVYPELARDTSELAAVVGGNVRPSLSAIRRLAGQPRQILAPLRTVGVREVQRVIAEIMDRVQAGQPQTISLDGRFPVVLISIDEFDRLRDLTRTVSWFRAAGLDLVEADEPEIAEFVRRFREGPAAAASPTRQSAEGRDRCVGRDRPKTKPIEPLSEASGATAVRPGAGSPRRPGLRSR